MACTFVFMALSPQMRLMVPNPSNSLHWKLYISITQHLNKIYISGYGDMSKYEFQQKTETSTQENSEAKIGQKYKLNPSK